MQSAIKCEFWSLLYIKGAFTSWIWVLKRPLLVVFTRLVYIWLSAAGSRSYQPSVCWLCGRLSSRMQSERPLRGLSSLASVQLSACCLDSVMCDATMGVLSGSCVRVRYSSEFLWGTHSAICNLLGPLLFKWWFRSSFVLYFLSLSTIDSRRRTRTLKSSRSADAML